MVEMISEKMKALDDREKRISSGESVEDHPEIGKIIEVSLICAKCGVTGLGEAGDDCPMCKANYKTKLAQESIKEAERET